MEKEYSDTPVILEQIQIERYKSCARTTFKPNSKLSALIGINGAGKTNILQAIRLLDTKRNRGRKRDTSSSASQAMLTAWFRVGETKIGLKIIFSIIESGRSEEFTPISETWNFQSFTDSKAWKQLPPLEWFWSTTRTSNSASVSPVARLRPIDLESLHLPGFDMEIVKNKTILRAVTAIQDFRESISYYSASQFTDPARCPSSFEVNEDGRLSDPYAQVSFHQKFIHDLYQLKKNDLVAYDQYCQFVSRSQLGLISRITWKEIELSSSTAEIRSRNVKKVKKTKILVIPKVQLGQKYMTFNQLSEGTFKTLALIFYIITDASRFLMIEEPEVCVHHGLLTRIISTIQAHAEYKQIVISTHSDLLVDSLQTDDVFVVEQNKRGTQVEQLNSWLGRRDKDALHDYLSESGSLGEYWRSGGLSK
jgi:ABC-type lipoprotein export system ATPase subunit